MTASSPLPSKPTFVILGSGPDPRKGNIADWISQLSVDVRVICIDHEVGGYEHDWTIPSVNAALCELVASSLVVGVFWAFSCGGWSSLHCRPGPPMLFDLDNLSGIRDSDGNLPSAAVAAMLGLGSSIWAMRA